MILLSAHIDRVIQDYDVQFKEGKHVGLLDNFLGVLLTYLVYYDDPNVRHLEREGKLKIWHNHGEEWGRMDGAPKLTKKDLVIVVDVAAADRYKKFDFGIENISGMKEKDIKELEHFLKWEGFRPYIHRFDPGDEEYQDESWKWQEKGIPCFCFSIPIQAIDDGWHRIQQDNTATAETMLVAKQGLKRILEYYLGV